MENIKIIELADLKLALRIDTDDEDQFLKSIIEGIEVYLEGAIDNYEVKVEKESFRKKAKLLSILIAQEFYDNRSYSVKVTNGEEQIKSIARSFMFQLQYCE